MNWKGYIFTGTATLATLAELNHLSHTEKNDTGVRLVTQRPYANIGVDQGGEPISSDDKSPAKRSIYNIHYLQTMVRTTS